VLLGSSLPPLAVSCALVETKEWAKCLSGQSVLGAAGAPALFDYFDSLCGTCGETFTAWVRSRRLAAVT